ncbi:MAG TPA: serine O-acetyltransferase [Clostridiales bacterium]|nr:serine O-acetyltransferase [Clostridiales bacterium]
MKISEAKKRDLQVIMQKDPAAMNSRIVRRTYTGYKALCAYRYAHKLWQKGMKSLALYVSYKAKEKTAIDIHPAANIGYGIFIDHGVGLVIGETAEIGDNCVLYQGVTLGGTGKDTGKRHPTLDEGVMVSAGAKVLGPVHIGAHSKIGAGSVVLKDVPPYSTVVGVPGRVVKQDGKRIADMDQILLPDPIMEEFLRLNKRVYALEKALDMHSCRYSITIDEDNVLPSEVEEIEAQFEQNKSQADKPQE